MRLRVLHRTAYRYGAPAARAIQVLRLTPRGHDAQFVVNWRIEVDRDCRLEASTDPFGNAVHTFTVEGPLDGLVITAEGEVETHDASGVVRGQPERMPREVFLRDTPLTRADAAIRALGDDAASAAGGDRIALLHALMHRLADRMRYEPDATDAATGASEAFAAGHGVCQDFAHVFVAAARHCGVPARYVGGYLYEPQRPGPHRAGHAWAEALVDGLGWVGFDAANRTCPTDAWVRVAVGLDYLGAAPVRGTRYGGADETLDVSVEVSEASRGQRQTMGGMSQSQIMGRSQGEDRRR